ncbi:MAG: hypothetical protein H6563_06155 [Lewinellaceae bacterium]|nr:hypothetical protein [Lewinellaceae bacterium]
MQLLDRLFGKGEAEKPDPPVKFGRYTDSYKRPEQQQAWEKSLQSFEQGEYMESYRAFFQYLRDEREDNVKFRETPEGIEFELFQGSKKVVGVADLKHVKAEARVAQTQSMNIGFLRRLIDQNYDLKYSRFALDPNNNISIIFDTYSLDGSPYKIYYGLKEMATNADKQDDLLVDEFATLESIDTGHLKDLPEEEKNSKYQYIQDEIKKVFANLDSGKPDPQQYPGALAYQLLYLCYKLDFLTKPEGHMMEVLERIHRLYFSKDDRNTIQKTHLLRKEFQKLLDRPREDFYKEMYQVPSTFGIISPVNHDKVVTFIDGELHNMDWYLENNFTDVALAIPGYIVGFCLFNYAIPQPDWDLFLLYFKVVESDYFRQLGFQTTYYDASTQTFNKKAIIKAIRHIEEKYFNLYPKLQARTRQLDFSSLPAFAKSYLWMVRNMDVTKKE